MPSAISDLTKDKYGIAYFCPPSCPEEEEERESDEYKAILEEIEELEEAISEESRIRFERAQERLQDQLIQNNIAGRRLR